MSFRTSQETAQKIFPPRLLWYLSWVYLEQEMFIQISMGWMSTWINVKTPFLVGKTEVTEGSSSSHYLIYDFYCRSKSNDMKKGVKIRYIKSSKTICNAWYHNKLGVYLNVCTKRKIKSYKSKWSFLLMDRRVRFCFLFVLIFKGIWAVNSISQVKLLNWNQQMFTKDPGWALSECQWWSNNSYYNDGVLIKTVLGCM